MMKIRLSHVYWVLAAGLALTSGASPSAAEEGVVSVCRDGKLRLSNNRVTIVLDEADGVWDASWRGGADAFVRGVGFAMEADGRPLVLQKPTTETVPVTDAIGSGLEVRQHWGKGIEVERRIRLYHNRPAVVVSACISNHTGRDVKLGAARIIDLSNRRQGSWRLAGSVRVPAAVGYPGAKRPCRPAPDEGSVAQTEQQYHSTGMLAMADRDAPGAMVIGCLSAQTAAPSIDAEFRPGEGGVSLAVVLQPDRKVLRAGETIDLDPVWLSVEENRYHSLERYGDAVAALAPKPIRTAANALWCSWYPLRMGISEEIVLANAAVAAEHFKPLGLDLIQLDHGWQRGDICGDWVPNERFPHGLKWLSDQLQSRYGMKMGLWIAPTWVAFTSQLFRDHPEWMMKNSRGQPASTGRWHWAPKPEMATLDVSQPGAEKWIEDTFARLSAEGASYHKIDFISWAPHLRQAMAAIRRGAGPNAWIRYCQTSPLLSAGLANSAYIGVDTGDAGLPNWIGPMRENAPLLAAGYWVNDRLYRREICDMSVGTKASVEEARFRLSLMTLSGCSIAFSDDLRLLELPRIRMMQQCLPPGNPTARPLDLFEREQPSLWHMHCKNQFASWDVVGMFNFEDQPQERTVALSSLGLPAGVEAAVFEFWEERFLGLHKDKLTLSLAPRTARILLIDRRPTHPQVIATNMHLLGGYHEIKRMNWDQKRLVLSGTYQRARGLEGKAYLYVPDGYRPLPNSHGAGGSARLTKLSDNLWMQEVGFEGARLDWAVHCEHANH